MKVEGKARYPLSIETSVKGQAENEARKNRRSLNAELGLLIEEALHARQQKSQNQHA